MNEFSKFIPKTSIPMIFKKVFLYLIPFFFFATPVIHAQDNEWCIQDAQIYTETGETSFSSCLGVGANLVKFKTTSLAQAFAYVVVDANNTILYVGLNSTIDLASFGAGDFSVYAFSYQGQISAQVGDDLFNTQLGTYCYGLTTNFIPVQNITPDGGQVTTSDGETEKTVCVGDDTADVVQFSTSSSTAFPFYTYVITDNDNNILGFSDDGIIDFNNSPAGECHLWGVAYVGNILLDVGDQITEGDFADECYDLSDNYVTIHRYQADGGQIAFEDGSSFVNACQGGNEDPGIGLNNTGNANLNYAYILADSDGNIIGDIPNGFLDFSSLPIGVSTIVGVSYAGDLSVTAGVNLYDAVYSNDCFDLSENTINIERQELDAGTVSLENGNTTALVCAENPSDLNLTFSSTAGGTADYAYVIADANGLIIGYSTDGNYDFNGFPNGIYQVVGLSYSGTLLAPVGVSVSEAVYSSACYGLTAQSVTVEIVSVQGGVPMTEDAGQLVADVTYCSTASEEVVIVNDNYVGTAVGIVVTDESGTIIEVSASPSFVPETDANHTYHIYSVAYTGTLDETITGGNIDSAVFSDGCFAVSESFVSVAVTFVDGGAVAFADGSTDAFVCANDDINGTLSYGNSSSATTDYVYLLTDEDGIVFSAIEGNTANLALLQIGTYHLYGVSYTGDLTIEFGDNIFTTAISDGCFEMSDNFLFIEVTNVDGGQVATEDNQEEYFICPESGADGWLVMSHANDIGTGYQYLVIDDAGIITAVVPNDTVFFADWDEGQFSIMGVSMTGAFTGEVGDDILAGGLSDGCFDLSDNLITVNYMTPNVGLFTTGEGASSVSFCVGDGESDLVTFSIDAVSASKVAYLITDEDGALIGVLTDDSFDFENAIGGPVHIYALAYTGNLSVLPGDNIFDVDMLSTDCWNLSEDFILVNKTKVDGGIVYTGFSSDTLYICSGDGVSDVVTFNNSSFAPEANYAYVLTNFNNKVISVMDADSVDFETVQFPGLRVWGISYTGNLLVGFNDDIEATVLADECYDISDNYITIFQGEPEGGAIDYLGETEIMVCVGHEDGQLALSTTSTSPVGYVYLLMDLDGVIQTVSEGQVDMTVVEPGMYRIWGLSYTGALLAEPGLLATQVELATSCFVLSDNFVLVEKGNDVDGGIITDEISHQDTIYFCPGDGIGDLVFLQTTSSDTTYHYVIADENGIVTHPQIIGDVIDFDAAPPEIARIYGISLNGTSNINNGTNLLEDELSDQCYTTSENFITVVPINPNPGTIISEFGQDVIIATNDDQSDVLGFQLDGATPHPQRLIVVNDAGMIVGISDGTDIDFSAYSLGTYHVYGVSYLGAFSANVGEDFDSAVFSDACYGVTSNFVTVTIVESFAEGEGAGRSAKLEETSLQSLEVKLSPNPARNFILVSIANAEESSTGAIALFDVMGRMVRQQTISNENVVLVDIENLVPGLYLLAVNMGSDQKVVRVIKE